MKLGSHNSMTFAKPKNWWLKPFAFMAKCQCKNLQEQFNSGVRYFDFRIAFDKHGEPLFAHGSMSYKYNVYDALDELEALNVPLYVRILNERNKDFDRFRTFCIKISVHYKNLTFVAGRNKKDWKTIYEFPNAEPALVDKYSSNNHDKCEFDENGKEIKHVNFTGTYLDDLFPRFYAWKNNKKCRNKFLDKDTADFLLLDFIGKY